ncbi:MAG: thioredoxin domain-containing protein [Candidatus Parcubacteria bacterium]|nr:thioredoxin domain-containing protein [Candidatus Parcubacteria bacterium]
MGKKNAPAIGPTDLDVATSPSKPVQNDPKGKATIMVVDDDNFDDEVLKSKMPVLVDFWSPSCAICHFMIPLINQVATQWNGQLKVCKLDVSHNRTVYVDQEIMALPTLIMFKNGKEVLRVLGYAPDLLQTMSPVIEAYL